MKYTEFKKNTEHIIKCVEEILITKQAEYAEDNDRLANFRQGTSILGTNPAQVCFNYDLKHICSIAKIVADIDKGIYPSRKILEEKIQDYLAYGILLYSQILELIQENESSHNGKVKVTKKPKILTEEIDFDNIDTLENTL